MPNFRSVIMMITTILTLSALWSNAQAKPFVDDLGREVDVPDTPKRIVSLYDVDVTIPLIELGIFPIASHGRMGLDGKPHLRSSRLLTGVDFDNSDIRYIGSTEIDLETITALAPDLIITAPSRASAIEPLQSIAPTVSLDAARLGGPHIYQKLAELTGTQNRLEFLKARYLASIDAIQNTMDPATITVSVFQPLNGKINIYHTYRSLGRVLRDAGFKFPDLIENMPPAGRMEVSAEYLPKLDADFIFDPYRDDKPGGAKAEINAMEGVFPGFCRFLRACQEGRFILISREIAISNSYAALAMMANLVKSHIVAHIRVTSPTPQ
ncbi:ABC transporter substrate-binding protein [Thalassospira alkalitolerans]|uniref:ABC transporter substrate-binding protein n=1 Tax=Thalassospira alkalitolerans TaxID=1293890 RepID=UPI003AA954C8